MKQEKKVKKKENRSTNGLTHSLYSNFWTYTDDESRVSMVTQDKEHEEQGLRD